MAIFKNGLISGRLGDLVFKIVDGKQVVCRRPAGYTPPDTPQYKERILRFSFCASLNAAINNVKVFEEHWHKTKITGRTNLNKLLKFNLGKIKPGLDISTVSLVYSPGYLCIIENSVFSDSGLTVTYNILNSPGLTEFSSLQGIILLKNPKDPLTDQYKFINFSTNDYPASQGDHITFTSQFSSQESEFINAYSTIHILLNLAFKDKKGYLLGFSGTEYIALNQTDMQSLNNQTISKENIN